jgi:hypothetical protein
MALTGRPSAPGLGPPAGLVRELDAVAEQIASATRHSGLEVAVDPLGELAARAAAAGLVRQGRTTCGGAGRLVHCHDGWIALNLPRADDVGSVPALVGAKLATAPDGTVPVDVAWAAFDDWSADRTVAEIVERGVLLGLPVAGLPDDGALVDRPDVIATALPGDAPPRGRGRWRVVDLSSLWAGPLCGAVLAAAGHDVVKVESSARPDGARLGPRATFHRLNGAKRSVTLDLAGDAGRAELRRLLDGADVVIEASRPRALQGWGLDVTHAGRRVRAWVSITAHGSAGAAGDRVGFGDDAAVSGGLVARDADGPWFCGDAIADPLSGLVAAATALDVLEAGGRWHLDVAMAAVAARFAGPTLTVPPHIVAADPTLPAPDPLAVTFADGRAST